MFRFFGFMLEVVITAHFIFIAVLAGVLSSKALGWLWDKICKRR